MSKVIYILPETRFKRIGVVSAIPSSWEILEGLLTAPQRLYAEDKISPNTRLVISSKPKFSVEYSEAKDCPYEEFGNGTHYVKPADNLAQRISRVVFKNKLVSSVSFDVSVNKEASMDDLKRVASRFIRAGYKGRLNARKKFKPNDSIGYKPEEISINQYKSFVEIEWDGDDPNWDKKNLSELVRKLEEIGLRELTYNDLIRIPSSRAILIN